MIPYSQFHLSSAQIDTVKRMNQRRDILKYIRENGCEPTEELAKTFFAATSKELEHERRVLYMKMYDAELYKDDSTPVNPNPGGNNDDGGDDENNSDVPVIKNITNLRLTAVNENVLQFKWDSIDNAISYTWSLKMGGMTVNEGTIRSSNVGITGLTTNTDYVFGVRANYLEGTSTPAYIDVKTHEIKLVLFYEAGFNSLTNDISSEINELKRGYVPDKSVGSDIVLIFSHLTDSGRRNYTTNTSPTLIRLYKEDNIVKEEILMTYDEGTSIANANVLSDILTKIDELFPRCKIGLVFSSHATAWLPREYYTNYTKYESREARPSTQVWGTTNISSNENILTSVGQEYYNNGSNIEEIEIRDFANAIPRKLEYIIFNACFMSSIEVLYELRDKCKYIVSSPCEIPASGFPYDWITARVFGSPSESISHELTYLCMDYFSKYETSSTYGAAVTLVDCAKLNNLAEVCNSLFKKYHENIVNVNGRNIQCYDRRMGNHNYLIFFDLLDIVRQSGATTEDVSILQNTINSVLVYEAHTSRFISINLDRCCGISMYLPAYEDYTPDVYHGTEFLNDWYIQNISWNESTNLVYYYVNHSRGFDDTWKTWIELPLLTEYAPTNSYYCHTMTRDGVKVRNYSFEYDTVHKISKWVAYPLNEWYIGNGSATYYWSFDPLISASQQANIVTHTFNGQNRYHLLPSSHRLEYNSNAQTFYSTNIVPAIDYMDIDANENYKIKTIALNNDEGYVVVGTIYDDNSLTTTDVDGKIITCPDFIYRIILAYKESDDKWTVYGVLTYFRTGENRGKSRCVSIRELEDLTGMTYYPALEKRIGTEKYNEIKSIGSILACPIVDSVTELGEDADGRMQYAGVLPVGENCIRWSSIFGATSYIWKLLENSNVLIAEGTTIEPYVDISTFNIADHEHVSMYIFCVKAVNNYTESEDFKVQYFGKF